MLSLARAFEIDGAETTCLWNSLSLLGKVEVFGTQVSGGIWWNLFVEAHYQIAFTSAQRPWTMSRNCFINYTHAHAQDDFSRNFNCILILAENHFYLWTASWRFIFPPPFQFKNGFFVFPAVRRESFFRTIISREKEREREKTTHLTIHWHESEPPKLTNSERKLQFCTFVSICMSKGNWEIVLECQVLLAVFSLW